MFFFVMMTAACCVQAQNEVERVLQSVEQHNTTLVALRHETEAAKVGNHTNLNLPNPEVEFGYLWGSPSSIGHRKDVSAVQSFDFATVTGAKRRLARQQDALADWQYKESRMQLLLEAHHLCLDAIYYNAMCKELMQRKQYAEEITSAQQKRLEQGDINRIEYNQVKLDLAAVSAELMRCNTERAAVMAELQRLNGGEPLLIEATDYPAVAIANDFEAWYAEAEQKSPALAYVKQQIDVANRELAVRRADGLPTVSAEKTIRVSRWACPYPCGQTRIVCVKPRQRWRQPKPGKPMPDSSSTVVCTISLYSSVDFVRWYSHTRRPCVPPTTLHCSRKHWMPGASQPWTICWVPVCIMMLSIRRWMPVVHGKK